jgi:hypothetical protein
VTTEEGKEAARKLGAAKYNEISSLLGKGVQDLYMDAIRAVVRPPYASLSPHILLPNNNNINTFSQTPTTKKVVYETCEKWEQLKVANLEIENQIIIQLNKIK